MKCKIIPKTVFSISDSTQSPKGFDLSGSLLPEVFPEGDPSQYALPVFLSEPKDAFTARGFPAKLGNLEATENNEPHLNRI